MTIQGRQLFAGDIALIRRLMAEHPDWHRSRLSIELCRMWNWRTDKSLLKEKVTSYLFNTDFRAALSVTAI